MRETHQYNLGKGIPLLNFASRRDIIDEFKKIERIG